MRTVTKIKVEMTDDTTGEKSSVEFAEGKIIKTEGEKVTVLETAATKMICETLNAQMGMMAAR